MMKRILAILAVLALAWPSHAHFVWLLPTKDGQVQMVFSDALEPDSIVAITKIAQTNVFARNGGARVEMKKTEAKDHYLITPGGKAPLEVLGICRYGVSTKKGDPYLLMYYAKTSVSPTSPAKGDAPLPLEIVATKPGAYQVLWQGKAITEAELTAMVPGEDDSRLLKGQPDGTFLLGAMPKTKGLIGLRAKFVEKKSGELDGKAYKEVRHYSTWTFAAP